MKTTITTDPEAAGFNKFNGGQHLCVEVPNENCTISCRLSDGTKVTFAFTQYRHGDHAPACVDVQVQTGAAESFERASNNGNFEGQGGIIFAGTNRKGLKLKDASPEIRFEPKQGYALTTHFLGQHYKEQEGL